MTPEEKRAAYRRKYSEQNKDAIAARSVAWNEANPGRANARSAAWAKRNPAKRSAIYAAWSERNKEELKVRYKMWAQENAHKKNASNMKRHASKLMATPSWANDTEIVGVYKAARLLTLETGTIHHVDHIVPLQSALVCGLHCTANLRVITRADNISKFNRYWPDMP